MRRFISIFTALFLSIAIIVPVNASASSGGVSLEVANVLGKPGETISVPVSIRTSEDIAALIALFSYDATAFELLDIEYNGALSGGSANINLDSGAILWMHSVVKNVSGSGTFCTLKFKVSESAANGIYPVRISNETQAARSLTVSPYAEYVDLSLISGNIVVQSTNTSGTDETNDETQQGDETTDPSETNQETEETINLDDIPKESTNIKGGDNTVNLDSMIKEILPELFETDSSEEDTSDTTKDPTQTIKPPEDTKTLIQDNLLLFITIPLAVILLIIGIVALVKKNRGDDDEGSAENDNDNIENHDDSDKS